MSEWSWGSYPQIYALGHRAVEQLLLDPVVVEEKVDGSQFSFGVFPSVDPDHPELRIRSKGATMIPEAPEKMFQKAVDWVLGSLEQLRVGWTYRAEYLVKPHHNALVYSRVPRGHLIIFDINPAPEAYLPWEEKACEADRLGLEVVPRLYQGRIADIAAFRALLDTESILGGQKIEGVVVKNYFRFGLDKKVLMGKFVSEAFKEVHQRTWVVGNPKSGDIIQQLIEKYRSPARWQKALMHLKEQDRIQGSLQDIGTLMKEVWPDIEKEEKEAIKDILYSWAADKVRRGVTAGLPEWYKEVLLKQQFEGGSGDG